MSYWHDISYKTNDTQNIQVGIEIPKFTLSKMELNKKVDSNPIMQDRSIETTFKIIIFIIYL